MAAETAPPPTAPASVRIASVGDIRGTEFREPFRQWLAAVPKVDFPSLAGDHTDRTESGEFR